MVSASFAFTGHSSSLEQLLFPQALLTLHLIGVSYWLGAFYPLRYLTYRSDPQSVAPIMKRFGEIALYAVGMLIVAGAVLLWLLLETPLALFESTYGRIVAIKLLARGGSLKPCGRQQIAFDACAPARRSVRSAATEDIHHGGARLGGRDPDRHGRVHDRHRPARAGMSAIRRGLRVSRGSRRGRDSGRWRARRLWLLRA